MSGIYVGTSGWSYKQWVKRFYPPGVSVRQHFDYYATRFPTVEINLTFYRLPSPEVVAGWARKAPPGFLYAVKGSRFITHMKKLRDVEDALDRYFERIAPLHPRIVCVLWQLPPTLHVDLPRLERFIKLLPGNYNHAVEFRHSSWLAPTTFRLMRKHDVSFVAVSSLLMPQCFEVTSNIAYIRFHGLVGGAAHDYSREELNPWAAFAGKQRKAGRTVLVYFNNDRNVCAPANAKVFMQMTGAQGAFAGDEQRELIAA